MQICKGKCAHLAFASLLSKMKENTMNDRLNEKSQKAMDVMLFQAIHDSREGVFLGYMLDVQKKTKSEEIFESG